MKNLSSSIFIACLIFIQINLFAQSNELIIGIPSDSLWIDDFDDLEFDTNNGGFINYYFDIDFNNKWDLNFRIYFTSGHWGGYGGIRLYGGDSTFIVSDTLATQWIGPCEDKYPVTTSMVKKFSVGDTLKKTGYFVNKDKITDFDVVNEVGYPCLVKAWLDDWIGGDHYIGIKKIINGKNYLGWFKVEVAGPDHIILQEFAINTHQIIKPVLRINEFMIRNETTLSDEYGEYDPWIEIYNAGTDSVWLGNKFLTNNIVNSKQWKMPDIYIQPGEFILIWADGHTDQGPFHANFSLNGSNMVMGIIDQNRMITERHYYKDYYPDISEGRYPDGSPGAWVFFNYPTPGSTNGRLIDLKINEFMASNINTIADENGEYDDWIELFNGREDSIFLGDLYMTDDLRSPKKWKLPDVYIKSGEFMLFWADDQPEQGPYHTNFKLDDDGEIIAIFPNSAFEESDAYTFSEQFTGISEGRLPDGNNHWEFFKTPTPGASNIMTSISVNKGPEILKVFPNPITSGNVRFNKEVSFKIYNANGQVITDKIKVNVFDISEYPDGLYLIVTDKGEKVKIIKHFE